MAWLQALGRRWGDSRAAGLTVFLLLLLTLSYWSVAALSGQGFDLSFDFIGGPGKITITGGLLPVGRSDSAWLALLSGIAATLVASVLACFLASFCGVAIGLLSCAPSKPVARAGRSYCDIVRSVPVLVQIIFWYLLLLSLPAQREALTIGPFVSLSNRGVFFGFAQVSANAWAVGALAAAGLLAALAAASRSGRLRGWQRFASRLQLAALAMGLAAAALTIERVDPPYMTGFQMQGSLSLSCEFIALVLGLGLYKAAFVAEAVRAGVDAVPKRVKEAATALGLTSGARFRLIVLPLAIRMIIPPLITNYTDIMKLSSLGVAIGYVETLAVGQLLIQQTGKTIETLFVIGAIYLVLNLLLSVASKALLSRVSGRW